MWARLIVGRQLQQVVGLAVRTLGNPGHAAELRLERHFRDIQAVPVHAPQEDTSLSILGRSAFARFRADRPTPQTRPQETDEVPPPPADRARK